MIRCSQGHENPEGSAFCDQCGEPLETGDAAVSSYLDPDAPTLPMTVTPRLIIPADNAVFDLSGKTEFIIGREDPVSDIYPDVDLTPHGGEEGGVSRLHAKVYVEGEHFLVEDQNSTNYTFLNRQKLEANAPTPLKDGDELRLGRVILQFRAE